MKKIKCIKNEYIPFRCKCIIASDILICLNDDFLKCGNCDGLIIIDHSNINPLNKKKLHNATEKRLTTQKERG